MVVIDLELGQQDSPPGLTKPDWPFLGSQCNYLVGEMGRTWPRVVQAVRAGPGEERAPRVAEPPAPPEPHDRVQLTRGEEGTR